MLTCQHWLLIKKNNVLYVLPFVGAAVYPRALQPSVSSLWDGTEHVLDAYSTVSTYVRPQMIFKNCGIWSEIMNRHNSNFVLSLTNINRGLPVNISFIHVCASCVHFHVRMWSVYQPTS